MNRFIKTENTLIDTKTRLEWMVKDLGQAPWETQNERALDLGDCWRLPNRAELITAYDDSELRNALKMHPDGYWSSSWCGYDTSHAWLVFFGAGTVINNDKANIYYARCVRPWQGSLDDSNLRTFDNAEFFYVYRSTGGHPSKRHDSIESAEAEAKRLAAQNPGAIFHVLACVASFKGHVDVRRVR